MNKRLVFATNNPNKIREVQALLQDIEILGLKAIGCMEEIPETAETLQGNARLKVDHIREHYGMNAFADDTGLEVDALDGAPGVYSARFAGPNCSAADNMGKLLHAMKGVSNRKARFRTVIALNDNREQFLFEGICEGTIMEEQKGSGGFGYDPIFLPDGHQKTFPEMDLTEKGAISHRGKAVKQLIEHLKNHML
jgi:XTP/dITP diphosphohydrolase